MKKVKRSYIVLGLVTQYDFNRLGEIVTYHEFKRLVQVDSLHSVISFCLSASYSRFRVVRRANKKFLTTLNCYKVGNSLIFG